MNARASALTHLEAVQRCIGTELAFAVEPKLKRDVFIQPELHFQTIYDVPPINVDILTVCINTEAIVKVSTEAIKKFKPKILLIEKPVSPNHEEILVLRDLCIQYSVKAFVNFFRPYLPEFHRVKSLITGYMETEPNRIYVRFNGSFINNGIHFLNFQESLFGELLALEKTYADYCRDIYIARTNSSEAVLVNEKRMSIRSDDLIIENSMFRLSYLNGGSKIFIESTLDNDLFPAQKMYGDSKMIKSNLAENMKWVYDGIIRRYHSLEQYDELEKTARLVKFINNVVPTEGISNV